MIFPGESQCDYQILFWTQRCIYEPVDKTSTVLFLGFDSSVVVP